MNPKRYGLPVIIAASLHGALFLISKETEIIRPPDKQYVSVDLPPIPVEPVAIEPEEQVESRVGSVSPKQPTPPGIPDTLRDATSRDTFTVPISPYRPSLEPVKTLEGVTGLPEGLENGIGDLSGVRIPDVGQLDRVPRAVFRRTPIYPDGPRHAGLDGSVMVEFVVGTDGRVVQAEAVKWSHREFVEPAVRAVREWRFEPGTQGGRKVRFRMAVPIEFNAGE
jgi:protein TonB